MLCNALHYAVTYDQLQIVNCAAVEWINARRELLEHAHLMNPEQPSWDGAADFMGDRSRDKGTLAAPKKVAFVAAQAAQRSKIYP